MRDAREEGVEGGRGKGERGVHGKPRTTHQEDGVAAVRSEDQARGEEEERDGGGGGGGEGHDQHRRDDGRCRGSEGRVRVQACARVCVLMCSFSFLIFFGGC